MAPDPSEGQKLAAGWVRGCPARTTGIACWGGCRVASNTASLPEVASLNGGFKLVPGLLVWGG